jgi:hypothetical protein
LKSKQGLRALVQTNIDGFLLIILIYLPRLPHLDVFLTADEPLFLEHARAFADGLATGDFRLTLGIGYPGVTLAGWAAPVVSLAQSEMAAYAAGRAITVLLTGLLLLVIYGLARALFGRWPAFTGMVLLVLDPYSLAYSRLLHIAAPLAFFMTLAGLSTLLWLRKAQVRWLIFAALFAGLALLTKSTALLLVPMLAMMVLAWGAGTDRRHNWKWWLATIRGLFLAAIVAVGLFFVLWPALWVEPAAALELTFGKLLTDQEAGAGNLGLFWFGRFVEDPGPGFYPVAFLLKATPWLLVGLLLSLVQIFQARSQAGRALPASAASVPTHSAEIVALWFFSVTYLVIMTIASKKSIRYMLPVFPVFYLLAGLAFYRAAQSLRNSRIFQTIPPSAGLLVPAALLAFTLFYHPYYLTYYNPLVLGWQWAPRTLLVGWGEGLDGAASYLNQQPPGRVVAWYEWLFPIQYGGEVQAVVPPQNLITADHVVLYINQVQRDIPGPNYIHYFRTRRRPEHTVRLAGIEYSWVYSGPIAGFGYEPKPQHPLKSGEFGGEARLLGYDLHPEPIGGGDSLMVTLYWRVISQPAADRFVYLRLVDDLGHLWARADGPPVMGLWPTTRWEPEMLIEDAHELAVPPGTPPGIYKLEVGLYDPASGQPLAAQGQSSGRGGGLLVGDVTIDRQSSEGVTTLLQQTDTRLSGNVRLTGYDPLPQTATTGDLIPVHLAWQEAGSLFDFGSSPDESIKFEWYREGQRLAEQESAFPWPVSRWGHRARLLSQHDVVVPPTLESGRYDLRVLLHEGDPSATEAFSLGVIEVTAPPHQFDLPGDAVSPSGRAQLSVEPNQFVRLAGYRWQDVDNGVELRLFWQPDAAIKTRYTVFVQLLDADNVIVAQSDSVPAAGRRPTTGWLPDEIIADAHRLNFGSDLPAGSYRLITGLYNPLNGQRLPVHSESGEVVADAILVAEVSLP